MCACVHGLYHVCLCVRMCVCVCVCVLRRAYLVCLVLLFNQLLMERDIPLQPLYLVSTVLQGRRDSAP